MTQREGMVLDFIKDQVRAGHGFPSREQIRIHMNWNQESSVRSTLANLAAFGHLKRWFEDGQYKFSLPDKRVSGNEHAIDL